MRSWTELCSFVTVSSGAVSHWIPRRRKCWCCLTPASLHMCLEWQQAVITSGNIFVLIMSVKTCPGLISLFAGFSPVWLFSWACTALPVLLVALLQPWDSTQKWNEHCLQGNLGQKLWFLFVWGFSVGLSLVSFKIILESSHSTS